MSSKRVKQYLLLLTAIGLISIAAGGSGTFASFTAEVNNPGNTFATGSLYLHDSVANMSECTSESQAQNSNTPETPGSTSCDTLFTVTNSQFAPNGYVDIAGANTTGALTGSGITAIDVLDWNGGGTGLSFGIANGAEVEFTDGVNTVICTTNGAVAQGATSITVQPCDFGAHSYGTGTIVSSDGPFLGHLTLRNQGSIDGSDLQFALDNASHAGCDQTATGLAGSTTLCGDTDFSITEVNSSWAATVDYSTGAITGATVHCAFPTNSATCSPTGNALGSLTTQDPPNFGGNWTGLFLKNAGGTNNTRQPVGLDSITGHSTGSGPGTQNANPGTGLTNPGGARYFLVEIWPGDLANADMGASATFDLLWHMDQA